MATPAGTAARCAAAALHPSWRAAGGRIGRLAVSKFGIGTHNMGGGGAGLKSEDAAVYAESIKKAVAGGVNLIDMASNYGSEPVVREALKGVDREGVVLVTKVGYVQSAEQVALLKKLDVPGEDLITLPNHKGLYCLHPKFVAAELERFQAEVGTSPDLVLLHNPEFILTKFLDSFRKGTKAPAPDQTLKEEADGALHSAMTRAFATLDTLTRDGLITEGYGVSSSVEGGRYSVSGEENTFEAVSVRRVIDAAKEAQVQSGNAGGEMYLRAVQLPLNLLEGDVLAARLHGTEETSLDVIARHGLAVMANRSLNCITPPGVSTGGDWNRRQGYFILRDLSPQLPLNALVKAQVRDEVFSLAMKNEKRDEADPERLANFPTSKEAFRLSLTDLALWMQASIPQVTTALVGARQPHYVDDLLAAQQRPLLPAPLVQKVFKQIDACLTEITPKGGGMF
eukprot:TRINITY_DN25270_c0_g1_i1.p1 TRINITY_DN25270_c0_g1~~TRINITY_DN25270_c0_g1_i1.p1  ORF type:complete len:454 (+),score=215.99 TRINITY_DN25270_c0_g1_i1:56-1417(+)